MNRAAASIVRETLRSDYPSGDIQVHRDFEGLRASVFDSTGAGVHFWVGDPPGVLSAVLGIGPDGDSPGDGGQPTAVAA